MKIDGEDVMEVEVYKERGEHWTRGPEKEKWKRRKNIEREREEWTVLLFIQTQSSREHFYWQSQDFGLEGAKLKDNI